MQVYESLCVCTHHFEISESKYSYGGARKLDKSIQRCLHSDVHKLNCVRSRKKCENCVEKTFRRLKFKVCDIIIIQVELSAVKLLKTHKTTCDYVKTIKISKCQFSHVKPISI